MRRVIDIDVIPIEPSIAVLNRVTAITVEIIEVNRVGDGRCGGNND